MAAIWLIASVAQAAPLRVAVPSHLEYCVASKPLTPDAYALPEVRDALFQTLSGQIDDEALQAQLPSIGVAFVDAVEEVPPAAADGAAAGGMKYIVHECAVVSGRGNPPLPAAGVRSVPARTLYATICASASIEKCKRDVEGAIRQEHSTPAELARPIVWRTRQALQADESEANLAASMSDTSLRVLHEPAPRIIVPADVVVVSGDLAPQ